MGFVILAAIIGLTIYYYFTKRSTGGGKSKLWLDARRKLNQPPEVADQTIERLITNLKERYPGHPEDWYLEKLIYDLERDR